HDLDAPAARDRGGARRARASAGGGVARAGRGGPRPARVRAALARHGAALEPRARERADRAPQPELPGRGPAADGPEHARLRADQRPPVPAPAARRRLAPGAVPAGPWSPPT